MTLAVISGGCGGGSSTDEEVSGSRQVYVGTPTGTLKKQIEERLTNIDITSISELNPGDLLVVCELDDDLADDSVADILTAYFNGVALVFEDVDSDDIDEDFLGVFT